jgi:hypothetical protein
VQVNRQSAAYLLLFAHKDYAEEIYIDPTSTGPDQSNRGGVGINRGTCERLGVKILKAGTKLTEPYGGALVMYKTAEDITALQRFSRWMAEGQEDTPPVLQQMSTGAAEHNHYTYWLRMCLCGALCGYEKITENGRISLPKLKATCPTMYLHATQGLRWRPLDPRIKTEAPEALDIISLAGNLGQELGMAETPAQLINTLRSLCMRSATLGLEVCREAVVRDVMAARSRDSDADIADLSGYLDYVMRFAKTQGEFTFIDDHRRYVERAVSCQELRVGGEIYSAISLSTPPGCGDLANLY